MFASIPSPPPEWQIPIGPFTIGSFTIAIHTYALCILAGIIVATLWTNRRLKQRGAEPGIVLDVIIWAVPLGLVGARLFHVLTHPDDYFRPEQWVNFWDGFVNMINITQGGNALFGSLIGGAVGAWIGCRITGIRFWSFADALVPGLLAAQVLGRLGNYFNQELFGLPTDLPWGLEVPNPSTPIPAGLPDGTLFHPTFLYEMLWNTFGIVVILLLERQYKLQWGKVWALYMIWYGIGRVWFESIRIDPSEVFLGLRSNVWAALAAILLGLILFAVQTRNHPGREPGIYVAGREWKPEGGVDSADTYSDTDEDGDSPQEPEAATSATSKKSPSRTS